MKGQAPCYDTLHCMRENNEISSNIFKTDDSGEAMSVGKEGNSADVWSLLRIPVKGSQEAEGKANAETVKKVNSTWYVQKPTKRPDGMREEGK